VKVGDKPRIITGRDLWLRCQGCGETLTPIEGIRCEACQELRDIQSFLLWGLVIASLILAAVFLF
jgi:hypothetical protein